jgi:hypothetical protein
MKAPFKYYLHDNYTNNESAEVIAEQLRNQGIDVDEDKLGANMQRPFYEIELNCILDTETFEVQIVSMTT